MREREGEERESEGGRERGKGRESGMERNASNRVGRGAQGWAEKVGLGEGVGWSERSAWLEGLG